MSFYNGCTLGISLHDLEPDNNEEPLSIDESMRVYAGVAVQGASLWVTHMVIYE